LAGEKVCDEQIARRSRWGWLVTAPILTAPIVTAAVFELLGVTYRYHEVTALDGLNLTITPGQRIALLGANGSGKSTLLSILDGLYFPQEGSVAFCGQPLTENRLQNRETEFDFRRRVALVFQNPDVQLFNPTVFDEVAFGPLQLGWPRDQILRRVSETLEQMEITHLKDRSPHHLSTGEKKRVALASVLILDPEVLLLDEPTAALDPKSESQMIDFLVSCSGGRKTVVTATHDLDLIEDIADCCHVFQRGRIVATGSPAEILNDNSLLLSTNLIHAHRHAHASGELHSHPHRHGHRH
jgi:cobalt/nickel transport system ATP-binding protein